MKKRSGSSYLAVLLATAILVAVGLGWFWSKRSAGVALNSVGHMVPTPPAAQKRQAHLYFADSSGKFLSAEQRVVEQPADVTSAARELVDALIRGPLQGGGVPCPVLRDCALCLSRPTGWPIWILRAMLLIFSPAVLKRS